MPEIAGKPRCPFYGFHWPAGSSHLVRGQHDECGLDLTQHGCCQMKRQRQDVDFDLCKVRFQFQNLLEAGKHYIRFFAPELPDDGVPLTRQADQVMRQA